MSRSTHQLRQQQKQQLLAQQQQIAENEAAAAAAELFDLLCVATTMRQVLGLYRNMCDVLGMRAAPLNEFYPKLKTKVRSWKAQALWKKFDARAAHRAYAKGTACTGSRVLVIGAGPCGLRTAIEAQLLGAKVVVVEKRDRISRNNVLHLWPFVITDLRNLGAKKFYGKFCAGSIDHISIRQLQCVLLKVALLLGVEVHEGVSFDRAIEPSGDGTGWRAAVSPADHAVSHYEFDVLIGADGKRNTLEGFKRKEFRGKLAIAITANFINKKTEAEAKAEEISGVAFIFNQSFFKELYHTTGIDLENIVYYKDETHYFVMTAKKHSLLDKGVIMQDFADPAELLAPCNVNTEKLLDYAREAAEFSTKYQMPNLEFAVNHYGKPDVAMFDFTSMFAAETSCRVIVRKGFRLLQCLVGDSLLEPFWPTGSGCARGFLSSMDAAYALKLWSNPRNSILGVLAQRESIYRLLNQTTPENLQRDIGSYTVDPATRYPNLNRTSVNVWQVKHLIDTDDMAILEQTFMDTNALQTTQGDVPSRRKRRNGDTMSLGTVLLSWICAQLHAYEFTKDLNEVTDIFTNGRVLCALINRYRPDLIDYIAIKDLSPAECNELAFKILDKEMQIPRIMSGKDSIQMNTIDSKVWLNYLEQICEVFRGEVPHVKHPKMDFSDLREKHRTNSALGQPDFSKLLQISSSNKQTKTKSPQDIVDVPHPHRRSVLTDEQIKRQRGVGVTATAAGLQQQQQAQNDTPRRAKKRRSAEKTANIEERQQRLKEIEENRQDRQSKRRQQRYLQTQNFYKSLHMLQANTLLRESDDATPFEDYSIFMYRQQAPEFNDRVKDLERKLLYPDRDRSDIPSAMPRGNNADDQFNDRIKSMEQRMVSSRNAQGTEKKPKDLMRAIGKIESSDWNVREIEKKIEQSRKTEVHGPKGREKVPKWSKEQFQARQKKMSKPARQESVEEKFKEIDQTLKNLDKQLKEGRILEVGERGRNKVASIAGQFVKKDESNTNSDDKNPSNTIVPKSSSKVALAFKKQAASEKCHFCKQTVYLMEKINAEGLVLHRSCLKCHHCHTNLRPGGYAFDRDDPHGRFYCTQHFRLPAKAMPKPVTRRSAQRKSAQHQQQKQSNDIGVTVADASTNPQSTIAVEPMTPEKLRGHADSVAQLDLLDRGQTPERIEFENTDAMSDGEPSEEHIIDEHEWSGRNFLPESNNDSESELSSSDESDTESESDMFEEANGSPIGAQTLQLVTDWIGKQNYSDSEESDDFYDSSDGAADDGKDDTDGEEFKKARELRREEVRLLPLPPNLPTDTETEVQSESESTSPDEVELNSATEISTDSEFDHDEMIRETPKIFVDDTHIRKPTKVQVKSSVVEATMGQRGNYVTSNAQTKGGGSYLKKYQVNPPQPQFKPLVQVDPTLLSSNRTPLQNPRPGDYLLNKTASTEGIASKKSLELKKRYLLGEQSNGNKIQKSGSTSVLDSRIRTFQSNISECQKLLNPSNDISASMRTFLDRTKLGENSSKNNDLMRSATTDVLKDLKVEITIQKASSAASTDNEKENVFVNSKNELNKGMEYSDTINIAKQNKKDKISTPTTTTPTNKPIVIETIDLITPEKCATPEKPIAIIDLTTPENEKQTTLGEKEENADSNKIADGACESTVLSEQHSKPDVSKDVKQNIPDILHHFVEKETVYEKQFQEESTNRTGESDRLLNNSGDEEKMDSPEKRDYNNENNAVQIEVPNIPWKARNKTNVSSATNSSWSSSSSSTSIEDIQHYILESTTSPDTNNTNGLSVPRVEVHDTTGNLMQIDSLMIVDGKYIGDPEDLKFMEVPEGIILPETAVVKTTEVDDEAIEVDIEPITATPEPADPTIIEMKEKREQPPPLPLQGLPPLPNTGPPKSKPPPPSQLKFDSKNENKIESLKHLPLIVEQNIEQTKAVKPMTLNLSKISATTQQKPKPQQTPTTDHIQSPTTPLVDNDKTPTADLLSHGSDSETEPTGTGQVFTETELSDWTADDCISENFIDTEFVLNSNKGTIKRNKKNKRKPNSNAPKYLSSEVIHENTKAAPVVDIESMFNSIDFEDIEFMDTGSEGSCAEAYSATNTALLKNRGYMEFIENSRPKSIKSTEIGHKVETKNNDVIKRNEKLGIDYIEQGAYIMKSDSNVEAMHDLLKTPVNEETPELLLERRQSQTQSSSIMTQSLTDSSTLNDLEDDSFGLGLTANSQTITSVTSKPTTTTTTATTEESEALTVVTSPIDSSSAKMRSLHKDVLSQEDHSKDNESPSSSDKQNAKTTTQSTYSPMSKTSSREKLTAISSTTSNSSSLSGQQRKMMNTPTTAEDQISYEEYVRALQQKVAQISTAGLRDSLDARKQRRKGSKGDPTLNATTNAAQTVIEQAPNKSKAIETFSNDVLNDKPSITLDNTAAALNNSTTQLHKVPEIPTLTRRLEEITKERTKQKDLIHDLVMDKLQSKKQLNAEKRLHRSRQRTLLAGSANGGYSSGSSLSPTPKIPATAIVNDANCANKAHYHASTAVAQPAPPPPPPPPTLLQASSAARCALSEKTPTYVAAYDVSSNVVPTYSTAVLNRQRPFSAHIDSKLIESNKIYELSKTSSSTHVRIGAEKSPLDTYAFAKPPKPLQSNLPDRLLTSISTENLRAEARARARLKSNTELGLSPEDKKRLQCHAAGYISKENKQLPTCVLANPETCLRELKMSASKSVNDLAYVSCLRSDPAVANENPNIKSNPVIADFTSDPNLLLSSISSSSVHQYDENTTRPKTKANRRQKDPDRRKSLIQSISSLFHKDKKHKSPECNVAAAAVHSAHAERTGGTTSGSNTNTPASGSVDGVLSLFRISPKSKEKSKSSVDIRNFGCGDKDGSSINSASRKTQHERSSSQDCMLDTPSKQNNKKQTITSPTTTTTKTTASSRTPAAFSSSSPQLYIHRPSYMNIVNDEQTPPPIPPLPINYQRSDDESYATETREQKKQRAISKAVRQAELKRLRIAQEIQREQEEIEVQLKELEARGVLIEKALRGEDQNLDGAELTHNLGNSDEKLLKELLDIWRNITQLKKRDEELSIRQKELQLEHRHAQLKEELNLRLSCNKLDKSSADVAAEGAILNEMLEIVAKRAALRPTASNGDLTQSSTNYLPTTSNSEALYVKEGTTVEGINLSTRQAQPQPQEHDESNI